MNYDEQLASMEGYGDKLMAQRAEAPTADQRTAQWLQERVGHGTASMFAAARDRTKTGTEGAKRRNYRADVLVERLTGQATEHYVNAAMQEGIENEPLARMAYEARTGAMVEQVGFIHHPTIKWVGGSPDGLVGTDGGVEFKCPQPAEHIRILMTKDISEYLPQIHGLMWITGRQWWDFESYCPRMPEGLQTIIIRVKRDDEYIGKLATDVLAFLAEVEAQLKTLLEIAAQLSAPPLPAQDQPISSSVSAPDAAVGAEPETVAAQDEHRPDNASPSQEDDSRTQPVSVTATLESLETALAYAPKSVRGRLMAQLATRGVKALTDLTPEKIPPLIKWVEEQIDKADAAAAIDARK